MTDNLQPPGAGDAPPERDVPLTADQQETVAYLIDSLQFGNQAARRALTLIDELRTSLARVEAEREEAIKERDRQWKAAMAKLRDLLDAGELTNAQIADGIDAQLDDRSGVQR